MNPYMQLTRFGRHFPSAPASVRQPESDTLDLVVSSAAYRWVTRIERAIDALASGLQRARRRRLAIQELSALPDRMLRDIGVDRGAIPRVVDETLAREENKEAR